MKLGFVFFLNAVLFGVGLAMDAFSVSLANGLNEPAMSRRRMCAIAGTFCFYQIAMPLLGWLFVHTAAEKFAAFQRFIPWIALALLCYIGGGMLREGLSGGDVAGTGSGPDFRTLMMQGVATSIDALSVGFTIAEYSFPQALTEALIIGAVTFAICMAGLVIGRSFGTRLAGKASVLGGVILIGIGLEIFITGII